MNSGSSTKESDEWLLFIRKFTDRTESHMFSGKIWHFPLTTLEVTAYGQMYGWIYSFEKSVEDYGGVINKDDFLILGRAMSGEPLLMSKRGLSFSSCCWLDVGFEYMDKRAIEKQFHKSKKAAIDLIRKFPFSFPLD